MRTKGRTYYTQEVTVEGTGAFPFDMLRYDSCVPRYESEIHLLTMTVRDEEYTKLRQIHLQRFASSPTVGPTQARWTSFLWKVVRWETVA